MIRCKRLTVYADVDAVIAVASQNGVLNLDDHDLKLLYSRRESNDDRIVATIVAVKEGAIRAKIEPVSRPKHVL